MSSSSLTRRSRSPHLIVRKILSLRGRIAEQLFLCETTRGGGDCAAASKESKVKGDVGNAAHDVVSIKYRHGEAEALDDDIEEVSQVLSIKQLLDNNRHEVR